MSALYTLLFVAPTSDAEIIAIDVDEDANERYPNAWLDHIGDIELVELWEVLDSESNGGTLMEDLAYTSPDGEVMVMTVPAEFVSVVSRLEKDSLESVAKRWHVSDGMNSWSVSDVMTVLKELSTICKRSVAENTPVLQVACM